MKIELTPAQVCHLASILAADAALMEALSAEYGRAWSKRKEALDRRILAKIHTAQIGRQRRSASNAQRRIMRRKRET